MDSINSNFDKMKSRYCEYFSFIEYLVSQYKNKPITFRFFCKKNFAFVLR